MGPGRMRWLAPVISKGTYRAARRPGKELQQCMGKVALFPAIPELGYHRRGDEEQVFCQSV